MTQIHNFASTGEAYNETQSNESVEKGHTLLILDEGVVGLAATWPVAVTSEAGDLHSMGGDPATVISESGWTIDQIRLAVATADEHGFEVEPWAREACADPSQQVKPFSWTLRVDVAPVWVADGFTLSDERLLQMLGTELSSACMSTELAASVIAAPCPVRIVTEQGYTDQHPGTDAAIAEILAGTPRATPSAGVLERSLTNAIKLLDTVAFVSHEGDNTAVVLAELHEALALIRGESPISSIHWQPTPA